MLTGRGARDSTWRVLDEWLDQWSGADEPPATAARQRRTTKKGAARTAAKKAATKEAATKTAAKKTATKRATTTKRPGTKSQGTKSQGTKSQGMKKAAADPRTVEIGTNPTRRYVSGSSRNLGRAGTQR
jgi:polyhydroxyalkanoate synthase